MNCRKIFKRISILCLLMVSLSACVLFFIPKPQLINSSEFSTAVYDAQHRLLRLTLNPKGRYRLYVPVSEIPKELIEATLVQEDKWFYWHIGINPVSLGNAIWQTFIKRHRRVGASTISMQVARLYWGLYSKSLMGKVKQIVAALYLESRCSKREILEAYFNLAPYGGNIEGVGAAALIYFNKPISQINLLQSVTLSVIPQNPNKRTSGQADLKSLRDHLFSRYAALYPQSAHQKMLFDLPMVLRKPYHPFEAPHFVDLVLKHASQKEITTFLDLDAQHHIERVTRAYLASKKNLGVKNAAVLLLDADTMSVKALLGSADFFNSNIFGQINGVLSKRSPGSTLKPFIYGLALDQGLIHPNTVLKDVPSSFNGYNPENFDYDFMGPIKAKDALVLSRNIPAIYLATQLKKGSFYHLLEKAQVSMKHSEVYYGLSMHLGGLELSMYELVGLYASLINGGFWYPLALTPSKTTTPGVPLLSPEASFLIRDILENQSTQSASEMHIAWKTGTSSGYRDAWTVGMFGHYVVAVWLGNFDNQANLAFVGKELAAPLFFKLVESLRQVDSLNVKKKTSLTLPPVLNIKKIAVCQDSGLLATPFCPNKEWTWFIPGRSPIKKDNIHREIAINTKTGLRGCHIDENTRFEVFEFWPSDLLAIFKKAGIKRHTPPFFEHDCTPYDAYSQSPQIISPQKGLSYVVRLNASHPTKIPLSVVTDAGVKYVYWFFNNTLVAKARSNKVLFWTANPGHYNIRLVDDHGLSDTRELNVITK